MLVRFLSQLLHTYPQSYKQLYILSRVLYRLVSAIDGAAIDGTVIACAAIDHTAMYIFSFIT